MTTTMTSADATALRKPFPAESVGKLPKSSCRDCAQSQRKRCDRHTWVTNCPECHGSHSSATVHLDYVGHAAATERLLTVDRAWTWEPLALAADGLPALDRAGNLWIRLTVCGVTRIGVGDGKSAKECIGDAIRNAAMRFGVALDLWAKEDLVEFRAHAARQQQPAPAPVVEPPAPPAEEPPAPVVRQPAPAETGEVITAKTRRQMFALFTQKGVAESQQLVGINKICGTTYDSRAELSEYDAQRVIEALRQRPDAPVVPDALADQPPAEPRTSTTTKPGPMTRAQERMLIARLAELGVDTTDDAERAAICSALVGREIDGNKISRDEATSLIDTLAEFRDRAALNAHLDALDAQTAGDGSPS